MTHRDVFVVSTARTAIGTFGGTLKDVPHPQLAPTAAQAGSVVTLWGEGPHGTRLPIDEVAQPAGTVGYELMCALAQRVPVLVGD